MEYKGALARPTSVASCANGTTFFGRVTEPRSDEGRTGLELGWRHSAIVEWDDPFGLDRRKKGALEAVVPHKDGGWENRRHGVGQFRTAIYILFLSAVLIVWTPVSRGSVDFKNIL